MVKIGGNSTSRIPGGFISLPGATYVADSKLLGLGIFLEGDFSSRILLRFDDYKPVKIEFVEFSRVVDYLEGFSRGNHEAYDSSHPGSTSLSAVLLESDRVMLQWEEARVAIFPHEFMLILNVLKAARNKLKTMIQRREERRKLLRQDALIENLRQNWDAVLFALIALLDLSLLVGMFFRPGFVGSFGVITLVLVLWAVVLRPAWLFRFLPMVWEYLNEGLLADISNLKSSQKHLGIAIAMIMLLVFYIYFGWEFISMVVSFFKGTIKF